MAEKSSLGTMQTDDKNLVWFGEVERKLAKLSMPTSAYCSSSLLFYGLLVLIPRLLYCTYPVQRRACPGTVTRCCWSLTTASTSGARAAFTPWLSGIPVHHTLLAFPTFWVKEQHALTFCKICLRDLSSSVYESCWPGTRILYIQHCTLSLVYVFRMYTKRVILPIEIDTLEYQQTEKIETELKDVDKIRIGKVYACCPGWHSAGS